MNIPSWSTLWHCVKNPVYTPSLSGLQQYYTDEALYRGPSGTAVINIRYVPLTNTFNSIVKRIMDIVGSLVCIVLFSPVMLVTAIAVKASSPGPLIYKQERVGLHNRPFQMYKFRSMGVSEPQGREESLDGARGIRG